MYVNKYNLISKNRIKIKTLVLYGRLSTTSLLMIQIFKLRCLPGHGFIKQALVSCCEPGQSSPLLAGKGLSHFLVRVLVPSPQVTEHVFHDPQNDHPPSTENNYVVK